MTKGGAPTRLNLWVLGQLFPEGTDVHPNRVEATRHGHLVRLVRAGLVELSADALRITPAGRAALAPSHRGAEAPTIHDTQPHMEDDDVPRTKTTAKPSANKTTKKRIDQKKIDQKKTKPSKTRLVEPKPLAAVPRGETTVAAAAAAPQALEVTVTADEAPAAAPDEASDVSATLATTTPEATLSRMPLVGTVLVKKDRAGQQRCACEVTAEGIRYQGQVYRSLSAAALAAARDLGLTSKTVDGFAWWGLKRTPRGVANGRDPLKQFDRAWATFRERVNRLLGDDVPEEERGRVLEALRDRARELASLGAAQPAEPSS